MKVVYDSDLTGNEQQIEKIASACGILSDTARLLYSRKIDTVEKAKNFLNPSKDGFFDPFSFADMRAAVNRITEGREKKQSVMIFGDYDADGISATTVLFKALKVFGIDAKTVIPEREEGYGLNVEKITAGEKPDLIITVDCGISDYEKIEILKKSGIDVIVTDHHEPPEVLPDCLIINPKTQNSGYPFGNLCGAGVAYKLAYALIGDSADEYLDFVALATVSDSMELVGENRDIVAEGLKIFNGENLRQCFKALLGDNSKAVTAQTLAFSVAPKINAGGRMGDALSSLRLFLSESVAEISEKAELLKSYNVVRQTECENIYREAKAKLSFDGELKSVITVYDEKWNVGFTGIVASRLAEEYSRPVIVFGETNGTLKGSARGVDGVNVYNLIAEEKDILLTFGGHAQAAGVGIEKKDFPLFRKRINEYFSALYKDFRFEKTVRAEWEVIKPLSTRFIKEIELLEPFGVGNRRPVFALKINSVDSLPIKQGSPHYCFSTPVIEMLDFGGENNVEVLSLPIEKTVVFETNRSVYKTKESVKGIVKKIIADYSDLSRVKNYIISNELDKITYGLYNNPTENAVNVKDITYEKKEFSGATLYAVSDINDLPENLKQRLPVYLFETAFCGEDSIVVSPRNIPVGFKRVIYLDSPSAFMKTDAESYCDFSVNGYKFVEEINVGRNEMGEIYKTLINFVGEDMRDAVKFYESRKFSFSAASFLFAVKVFAELGIIDLSGGRLKIKDKKSALNDSVLYNKIVELKRL